MQSKDQLHRILTFPKTPKRIVSLVPSQTELLVDLGLRENVVGITKFCVHPKNIRKEITVVGGTKKIHFDKIERLSPDIIICNKEENTKEMVEKLETIAPVWISDIITLNDSIEMIKSLGKLFDVSKKAEEIIFKIEQERELFLNFIKDKPFKKAAYVIWKNPYMLTGKNTFIDSLLQLNHFENIITSTNSRYPEIESELLKKAEVILLSSEPFPFKEKDVKKLEKELNTKVILVDGEYFSWYGSRLQKAFEYFKTLH